uniref:Uncharacterized protein n=1 Tax=viral metagenome TaxID=1070528 RepID=A0A6M3X5W1_9ZZZZ
MNIRRMLTNLWVLIQKGIELQAYTELYLQGGMTREEYISKMKEIDKQYE